MNFNRNKNFRHFDLRVDRELGEDNVIITTTITADTFLKSNNLISLQIMIVANRERNYVYKLNQQTNKRFRKVWFKTRAQTNEISFNQTLYQLKFD